MELPVSNEIMWRAVQAHDPGYDGVFYFGVTSTGVFCRPSCKSRLPRPDHVRFFAGVEGALAAGFRPCKRCRPDLTRHEPLQEMAARAAALLEREYANPSLLADLARRMNVSPFHLQRTFKKQTGLTPREYLRRIRVRAACRLLLQRELGSTAICDRTGFQSLSGFYAAFRAETGLSPKEYRTEKLGSYSKVLAEMEIKSEEVI